DHLEVGFQGQQGGQGAAHQGLVVRQQQPDAHRTTSTIVPGRSEPRWAGRTLRMPPASVTRCRMPRSPVPDPGGTGETPDDGPGAVPCPGTDGTGRGSPRPSSDTVSRSAVRVTVQVEAPAWRITLV